MQVISKDQLVNVLQQLKEDKRIITLPCKVKDLIDTLISHNEVISLWCKEDQHHSKMLWKSEGHKIPEEYLNQKIIKIFGCIPEKISESDTINILIKFNKEDE